MIRNHVRAPLVLAALALVAACRPAPAPEPPKASDPPKPAARKPAPPRAAPAIPVTFTDVTESVGVTFRHENAARGKRYLPETMGSGVVVFDFDGDDALDLFFVNSVPWPADRKGALPTSALHRNRGDGTFEDATAKAGLDFAVFGMGATAGDYDGDGDADLFVACLGPDHLMRNDGGRFVDVTSELGISDDDFGSSATWLDHDKDGDLDLFVGNYVDWRMESDIRCTLDGRSKSYCTPESYTGVSPRFWRNDGKSFTDATKEAGVFEPTAKTLGVVAVDYDADGWTDIVVVNDLQPNLLLRNRGDGKFEDVGLSSGIAYDEQGLARGAMGVDAADLDGTGRPSLVVGNFSNEMLGLYQNTGNGLFVDIAPRSNVGRLSLLTLAFGTFFFDFDLDGHTDIFVANGHLEPEIEAVQPNVTYAQPSHLFRSTGDGEFEELTKAAGEAFAAPRVARGAAFGDLDRDGDLDVVVTVNGGPARVFRNDGGNAHHWISLLTRGTKSNRDGLGAVVQVTAGGRAQTSFVKAGTSYLSQSQRAVTFGLGDATRAESVKVTWPSGQVDTWSDVAADRHLVATEGAPELASLAPAAITAP